MGGTFDPIHHGHLRAALEVSEALHSVVHLMPAAAPPHRDGPSVSAQQRLALCQAAVQGEPCLQVDGRELRRSGPSYSVETLREIRAELGSERPLCWVLGSDALLGLRQWFQWEALSALCHLVVLARPGWHWPTGEEDPRHWLPWQEVMAGDALLARPAGCLWLMPQTPLSISATYIRQQLGAGHSVRYLVPEPVYRLIEQHGLYRDGKPCERA